MSQAPFPRLPRATDFDGRTSPETPEKYEQRIQSVDANTEPQEKLKHFLVQAIWVGVSFSMGPPKMGGCPFCVPLKPQHMGGSLKKDKSKCEIRFQNPSWDKTMLPVIGKVM